MRVKKYLIGLLLTGILGAAQATYTVNILQSGPNVVMTGAGSIDTTGMTFDVKGGICESSKGLIASTGLCVGAGTTGLRYLGGLSTPLSGLGSDTGGIADSATGAPVFVIRSDLRLPAGYVSSSPLSSSSTFNGTTLAALGLTSGTKKTLTLTSGDTIVINIGPQPAPESVPTLNDYALWVLAAFTAFAGWITMKRNSSRG